MNDLHLDAPVLDGWTAQTATHDGEPKLVYRAGEGRSVIVISEMPGITPQVAAFGQRLVDAGYSVSMPSLFGTPGRPLSVGYAMGSMVKACVSSEFHGFATGKSSPVITWLRAFAAAEHERCGGPGVGVIGMCFTGGFALAMMVDDTVVAPVLSQPSLPFAIGGKRKRDIGVSPDELRIVKERAADGCAVLGLRFTNDVLVPADRFATLRAELGDDFIGVEIDSSPGNPHDIAKSAHSVLTNDLVDEPGHPTRDALDQVMAFLAERLN